MASFMNGDVEIAYLDEGEGEPIVLVHGFASDQGGELGRARLGRRRSRGAGRRAIALDNRGHGASTKLYDPARYDSAVMAEDVRGAARPPRPRARRRDGLLDGRAHRGVPGAGASHARALRVLGGLGIRLVEGVGCPSRSPRRWRRARSPTSATRRAACSAPSPSRPNRTSRRSPPASAARARRCRRDAGRPYPASRAGCGRDEDTVAGSPQELAALIPGARALDIPKRDHMLAVGDKVFKTAVLDFLNRRA